MTQDRIYLDYAATTPVRAEVLDAMLPYFSDLGHNPSSLHREGRRARAALDDARDRVAASLGASRREIVFTGSGSEADNQAIFGAARANRERGTHLLSTAIEHHAVLHALDALAGEGFAPELLAVDGDGQIDPAAFAAALTPRTILATVMYANNEIGAVAPIRALARLARERGTIFHTDAVQAAGWLPIDVRELEVDLLSLSAHKFHGPKGVGVLYVRDGVPLPALVHGGGQEGGRRSGTENVAGIVGLARALELAVSEREEKAARVGALRDRLEGGILAAIPEVRINGAGGQRLPNSSNLSFAGVDSETLLMALDVAGIAVSAGSACTSGALEPSHVIAALGAGERWQRGVIRFSLGADTTCEQIERVVAALPGIIGQLRSTASLA